MSRSKVLANLGAGVTGGAVFLGFLVVAELGLPLALLSGAAAYGAGLASFGAFAKKKQRTRLISGVTPEMLADAEAKGQQTVATLRQLNQQIDHAGIHAKVEEICVVIGKIMVNFRNDPKDLHAGRRFVTYYLDATVKVVEKYASISERRVDSDDIEASLQKVEAMLDKIHHAFEQKLLRFLEDDVIDLDSELELLDQTIKMDGLEKKS